MNSDVDLPQGPWALINQGNPWWLGQQPGGEIQAGTTCDIQQRALPRLRALYHMPRVKGEGVITTLAHRLGTSWSLRQCRGRFLPLYDEDIANMYAQLGRVM